MYQLQQLEALEKWGRGTINSWNLPKRPVDNFKATIAYLKP
jgi:hypothetical protein